MAKRNPFKFQSLLKLNNRIIEQDLRLIASTLVPAISNIKDKKLREDVLQALDILITTGARLDAIVQAQKALSHSSSQEELEQFFKLVTKDKSETKQELSDKIALKLHNAVEEITKNAVSDTECNCPACRLKRTMFGSDKPTTKNKQETTVKMYEIKVPDGINPESIIQEIIAKTKGK